MQLRGGKIARIDATDPFIRIEPSVTSWRGGFLLPLFRPNQSRCEKSAIDIVHSSVFQQYFFKTQSARRCERKCEASTQPHGL
jgi:hypothetical protein